MSVLSRLCQYRSRGLATAGLFGLLIGALPAAAQQTGTITGRVTATGTGEPLAGVNVTVEGTKLGAATTDSGSYRIMGVPVGSHQLMARRLGFAPGMRMVTVRGGDSQTQNFELGAVARLMEGVVVTGEAGATRKKEIGNSVTQLSVAEDLKEPTVSVENLLQGRATGLMIADNSGAIGGGAQIRLRGNGSYTLSNTPLIFVDGARIRSDAYPRNKPNDAVDFTGRSANVTASPLNDINPNDIERIEVIKGAAATALYGTEAAGGVIQIFTKRGKSGAVKWNVRVDQGFKFNEPFGPGSDPYMRMDPWMRGAPQWITNLFSRDMASKAKSRFSGTTNSCAPSKDCTNFATATSGTTPVAPGVYKYPGTAASQVYGMSAAGGAGDVTYFLSGQTENNLGILPNDDQKRYSLRGNLSFLATPNLKIDWNTSFNQDNHNQTRQGGDVQGMTSNAYRGGTYIGGYTWDNMNALLNQTTENHIGNMTTSLSLNHNIGEKLVSRFNLGISRSAVELRALRPFAFRYQPTGALSQKDFFGEVYTVDYSSTWKQHLYKTFGVDVSWGGQAVDKRDKTMEGWSQNFPGPGQPTMESGGFSTAFEERIRVVNAGFFGQARFSGWDRLFVTVGMRVDGNSAFGKSLGLQSYPKVTGSYTISDESFWPKSLGTVKLRGAVGEAGRAPGAFDAIRTWNPTKYGSAPGFLPRNLGNDALGPERTREYEVGFEGSWLDGKLSADFTLYNQKIRDALLPISVPGSQGAWLAQATNVGVIENKGTELQLTGIVLNRKSWGVDLGLGVTTNKNKLISQGKRPNQTELRVGYPVPAVYGTMIMNRREIAAPIVVKDTVFGSNQPTLILQPSFTLRFPRNVTLSGRGEYQGGFFVANTGWAAGAQRTEAWPTCENYPSRIAKGDLTGIEARFRMFCNYGVPIDPLAFRFDATFFKVRDITLQLPLSDLTGATGRRLFGRSSMLSFSLRNAFRWVNKDWLELDPEMIGRSQAENTRGVTESMPPQSTFTMAFQTSF